MKLLTRLLTVRLLVLLGYTRTEYKLNSTNVDAIGGASGVVSGVLSTFEDAFAGPGILLKDIFGTEYSPGKGEGTFPQLSSIYDFDLSSGTWKLPSYSQKFSPA